MRVSSWSCSAFHSHSFLLPWRSPAPLRPQAQALLPALPQTTGFSALRAALPERFQQDGPAAQLEPSFWTTQSFMTAGVACAWSAIGRVRDTDRLSARRFRWCFPARRLSYADSSAPRKSPAGRDSGCMRTRTAARSSPETRLGANWLAPPIGRNTRSPCASVLLRTTS